MRSFPRSSRLAETRLRATGPASLPRPSRDRTSASCSLTSELPPQPVVPLPLVALVAPLPLRRSQLRRKKRKRPMSTWVTCSAVVMTTIDDDGMEF